ncbi:hypothetical protein D5086_008278 [Populus alba]|uniref:Uncharacterized protein n=3 Tax=Populus TaxID=3689 RepID=A0ACC4CG28_POPAL|nr:uncharacterized protein LOC118030404 [Populus alba]KAJ7000127.1 hypothetical protein NC653_010788 [Populus alba x Populus x berolinensis]TKR99922.1 hypothetical protein D5086_0000187310 [Populus alba]
MNPKKVAHNNFFSSLRQVEKRLKLENPTTVETNCEESLSTPLYLHTDQEPINNNSLTSSNEESSEPPLAFLSPSLQSSPKTSHFYPKIIKESKTNDIDDIQHLIQLLGLSGIRERNPGHQEEDDVNERVCVGVGVGGGDCCGCEGGFFEKIVGVKGPKCEKEVERLEGWIRYFLGDGGEESREPLMLAFLLLGKAAYELEGADGGGLDFPSTIEEFLKLDPPEE